MKVYRVTFQISLEDSAGNPANWIPDAIFENLNEGEECTNWTFCQVTQNDEVEE